MEFRKAITSLFDSSDSGLTGLDLRSSLESPAVPLNSPGAVSMALAGMGFGTPTAAGEQVNERNALENPTVYTCVTLIASGLAAIPFKVYSVTGKSRTEATNHSLSYLVGTEPNPEMTSFTFFEAIAGSMALTGNGYAEIERDDNKNPIALWPRNPLKTQPKRDPKTGQLIYVTGDGMQAGAERIIAAADMLHCPLFSFDGLKGQSPIGLQRQEIGLAQATLKAGARVFGNGLQPAGLLIPKSPTVTPTQQQQVRETLEKQASGDNRGRLAVMPTDWTYQQLAMTMADAEFIALRNMSRAMICAIFKVDPHYAGDTTRQASANHEQMTLSFLQETLQPYLLRIEQEFRRKLLPMTGRVPSQYEFGFDTSARLRTDIATTLKAIATARQWTIFSVDEGRAMLGLNPIGGDIGDMRLSPINMINAEIAVDWEPQAPPVNEPEPDEKEEPPAPKDAK